MPEPTAVLARHQLTGPTRFSHHSGSSYVQWPKCGCGQQIPPWAHPQHLLDVLNEAGFTINQARRSQGTPESPTDGSLDSYCGRGVCCLGAGHEGRCEQ